MIALLGLTEKSTFSSLGFGIPRTQPGEATEQHSLLAYDKPILVDADGLNALAKIDDWWTRLPEGRLVLTPHVGEFSRLMDMETRDVLADPERAAVSAARKFRQIVLLKGAPTIVTDGTTIYRATDAPPSLATGGSGDVLSGTIGALLAQGLSLVDAANLGVYAGVKAARRLETELGTLGLVASDLPRAILPSRSAAAAAASSSEPATISSTSSANARSTSVGSQGPSNRIGAVTWCCRNSAASPTVATPSIDAPDASAHRLTMTAPCPYPSPLTTVISCVEGASSRRSAATFPASASRSMMARVPRPGNAATTSSVVSWSSIMTAPALPARPRSPAANRLQRARASRVRVPVDGRPSCPRRHPGWRH
jgi:hypothetical protein